jgi:hypothetical protein
MEFKMKSDDKMKSYRNLPQVEGNKKSRNTAKLSRILSDSRTLKQKIAANHKSRNGPEVMGRQ